MAKGDSGVGCARRSEEAAMLLGYARASHVRRVHTHYATMPQCKCCVSLTTRIHARSC